MIEHYVYGLIVCENCFLMMFLRLGATSCYTGLLVEDKRVTRYEDVLKGANHMRGILICEYQDMDPSGYKDKSVSCCVIKQNM